MLEQFIELSTNEELKAKFEELGYTMFCTQKQTLILYPILRTIVKKLLIASSYLVEREFSAVLNIISIKGTNWTFLLEAI